MKYSSGMLSTYDENHNSHIHIHTETCKHSLNTSVIIFNIIMKMNDNASGLFVNSESFLPCHCRRLVKTVENATAVELRCLLVSAQSVNISQCR